MNLTSKRMLQFIVGCAGVCALSAFATQTKWVEDTFEDGTVGQSIGTYKQVVTGGSNQYTNYAWIAANGDLSVIATNIGSYAGTRPSTNAVQSNQVLTLSTEGQTLTRNLGVTNNFLTGDPFYVDTLIKFTPSEDNPTISDSSVKAAVFVNVSSNLVIYHGDISLPVSSTDVGLHIDPTAWYRLTIKLGTFFSGGYPAFQVYVNGTAITNAVAYDDNGGQPGTWFVNASQNNTISAVAFQGTGMVDDLVVSSMANGFGTPAAILLTLSFNSSQISVSSGGAITNGGTVTAGSTITVTALDWYNVASVSGTGVTFSGNLPGKTTNGVLTAAAPATVSITAAQYSSGTVSTGAGNIDASKLSTWALAKGVAESALSGTSWYNSYLFNVATNISPVLTFSAVSADDTNTKVVITTTPTVTLSSINGTLKTVVTASLGTPFGGTNTVSVSGAGAVVTNTILNSGSSKFVKALVQ